jgi:lipoteichoic acid synthase
MLSVARQADVKLWSRHGLVQQLGGPQRGLTSGDVLVVLRDRGLFGARLLRFHPLWRLLVTVPRSSRWRLLALESAPVVVVAALLTTKMIYFSVALDPTVTWYQAPWWIKRTLLSSSGAFGTLLLALAAVLLLSRRRRLTILWTADFLLTLIVYADVLYVRYFGDVLSVAALGAADQVGMVTSSVFALMKPADILFFADLAFLPLIFRSSALQSMGTDSRRLARQASVALLAAGLALSVFPVATLLRRGEYDYFKLRGASKVGLLNYHVYDLAINLRSDERQVTPEGRARAEACLKGNGDRAPGSSELFGVARGKNLILVMVESLHAFPLGSVVNGTEVTPNLNALARRSISYENFYDQTWQGVTSDGEFTALQSLHPVREGGVPIRFGRHRFFALPHVLAANGYATMSAHGYSGAIWMMATAHRAYGIEQSLFRESFDQREQIGMGLSDASFFRQMLPRLAAEREPFMAFLVTLSTHFPYDLPDSLRTPNLAVPEGTLLGSYLQSVHQLDKAIGELVAGLTANGLLDRSILAVFGDHWAFDDQDELGRFLSRYAGYPPRRPGFDPTYWRAAKRLPFLIHLPNDAQAGPREGSAGHLDIAPTLLSLLGITEPRMVTLGRDLTVPGNSLVVFRNGGFVVGDTVCLRPTASQPRTECGLLGSGAELDSVRLRARFREAEDRLTTSDLLVEGDLIPWATEIVASRPGMPDSTAVGKR